METAAGVGAAGAVGLFGYNRHNFLYDRKLRQETEYQIMDFRIKQAELWRDDVRDIVGLTSVKMDTYLILNTVQLGFCVMAFCEGRLALGTPTWLISCHTLSLAGASMYLFMSIWMAMHASVTAKSYEVRLLTQLVRLPIPTWAQMEGARTYGSSFEKVEAAQMFRVPFLTGSQESVQERIGTGERELASESGQGVASSAGGAPTAATEAQKGKPADLWGLEGRGDQLYELDGKARVDPSQLRHLRLVREALQYWQSYDAFARVSMSLGTNQLVTALSYYVLGYVLIANHAVMASWFTVGLFMAVAAALIRLDMSLTTFEYYMSVALVVAGPLLTAVASHSWVHLTPEEVVARDHPVITALVPIVFAAHSLWFLFLLYVCKVGEQKGGAMLPVGFRSVMYIDIFGWIKQKQKKLRRPTGRFADAAGRGATPFAVDYPRSLASWDEERACEEAAPLASQPPRAVPCAGPAIQSVTHDPNGRPLPLRPEALPGAAEPLESVEVHAEDFVPTTFVPWLREEDEYERYEFGIQPFTRPGLVPWRIFVLTTVLLMILWFIVGVTHVMAFLGDTTFKVHPLTEDDGLEDVVDQNGEEPIAQVAELSGGHPFSTRWPRVGIRPHSLSCAAASGGGNHDVVVVAATHFRLLTARISAEASDMQTSELQASRDRTTRSSHGLRASAIRLQDTSPPAIRFEEAPLCQELEGESIQDIAAYCGPSTNRSFDNGNTSCHAWVLHRQGQRLSMCPLKHDEAQARAFGFHGPQVHAGSLSTAWLQERDETYSLPQEEVSHLAVGGDLCGGTPCAYAQTSSRRIVELANGNNKGGDAFWFPARVLHSGKASKRSGITEGGLHVVGEDGRYLMVFRPQEKILEIVDVHSGDDTRRKGVGGRRWRLPQEHQWTSACSVGNSLFLLSGGHSQQLWRFPLPHELRGSDKPAPKANATANPGVHLLQETAALSPSEESPPAGTARQSNLVRRASSRMPQRGRGPKGSAVVTSPAPWPDMQFIQTNGTGRSTAIMTSPSRWPSMDLMPVSVLELAAPADTVVDRRAFAASSARAA